MDRQRIARIAAEYIARFSPVWAAEASPLDSMGPVESLLDFACHDSNFNARPGKEQTAVLQEMTRQLEPLAHEWAHVVNEDAQKFCWRMACQREAFPRVRYAETPVVGSPIVARAYIARNAYFREGEPVHQLIELDAAGDVACIQETADLWQLRETLAAYGPHAGRATSHLWRQG